MTMPAIISNKPDGNGNGNNSRGGIYTRRHVPQFAFHPPPEPFSPITLRIKTAVHVTSSNNVVCLQCTPEEAAAGVARAVMEAMVAGSVGKGGIPMIDEEGRPRPVDVEVDAGWWIEGEGNIVGREGVVREVVREKLRGTV